MGKIILTGSPARAALLVGVTKLNDLVKITLGPEGRHVIFNAGNQIISTKDGVTVAREVVLNDPFEAYGAEVAKSVAGQAVDQAGDGTTTATLLIQAIFEGGVKAVEEGYSPVTVAKGIKEAARKIVGAYDEKTKRFQGGILELFKVETTPEIAFHVARISANGDEEIAKVVSDAVLKVGVDGAISIGTAQSTQHQLEMVEGLKFESGLANPYFVNDPHRNRAVYDNCLVFICDRRISTQHEALKIMEKALKLAEAEQTPFALLVIANDIDPEAMGTFVTNRIKNGLSIVAITSPAWGPARRDLLEDVALVTKGDRIDGPKGENYANLSSSAFGHAARIVVTQQQTIIAGHPLEDYERAKKFDPYVARVRALAEDTTIHPADQDRAKQRLASLAGGVAIVKVGGNSGGEVKERGFRVEDAIHATRAAVADGIVPGGGSALAFAQLSLGSSFPRNREGELEKLTGEQKGEQIIADAITMPMIQIARNAGVECPEMVLQDVLNGSELDDFKNGFDASKGALVDNMIEAGIVDPLKVVRSSLNAAATAAAQLLLTEGVIALEPQKQ